MGEIPNGIHRSSAAQRKRLGEECKILRDKHLLTLTAIAERKGVSVNSVRNWIDKVE